VSEQDAFDYVVVGAGAAGCVVAHRLARAGRRVLLLEAGGADDNPAIHATDLGSMLSLWGSDADWKYSTEPGEGVLGRRIPVAQGKVLGGGTSINAMMYIRGNRRDYDHWNQLGNEGWSYADVLPYFKKSEDYEGGASAYRGAGGPLRVIGNAAPAPVSRAFVAAAMELGFAGDGFDCNGEKQEDGAFLYQSTRTSENRRCSAATAFLKPVAGEANLTLVTGALVARVLLDGARAAGVEYVKDGAARRAAAEGEVILCAGAFASPKLLMLSGIGPAQELKTHGLPVVADLAGVGRNLQDHMLFGVGYKCRQEQPAPTLLSEAGLFTRSRPGLGAASPDLQFFFGPVQFVEPEYRAPGPGFTFVPVLIQPQSRGEVRLRSANPHDPALVSPNYLQCQTDVDVLVQGIELARRLARTRALEPFRGDELAPGAAVQSRQDLAAYVRKVASTVWHPVGTCRMGRGTDAVVDPRLRVHGVERLRVADASIMPRITAGNTNAPTLMIGEKAADMLLEDKR
jgi:choline dehydrogenase